VAAEQNAYFPEIIFKTLLTIRSLIPIFLFTAVYKLSMALSNWISHRLLPSCGLAR
jgi:hypothetical protein